MADWKPIPTPPAQRIQDLKRRVLPVVVWVGAATLAGWLMLEERGPRQYIGLAQAFEYPVSAPTTGTLTAVPVQLFDDVEVGDVVARLDDTQLLARIETARATVRQLNAQLQSARAQIEAGGAVADYKDDLRRFQIDEEERRLQILNLRVGIETDTIEAERLDLENRRFELLQPDGLVSQRDYDNTRLRLSQVHQRIEDNQELLRQTEREYQVAQQRRRDFERGLGHQDWQLAPLTEAISVEDARLREIETLRAGLLLKSPIRGQVSQIWAREGQSVTPGDPVVTITDPQVGEIVAFIGESDPRQPRNSSPVRVANLSRPGRVGESIVIGVSPDVQMLPQQLWRNPTVPDFGRPVRIGPLPALSLTPGERVRIQFLD